MAKTRRNKTKINKTRTNKKHNKITRRHKKRTMKRNKRGGGFTVPSFISDSWSSVTIPECGTQNPNAFSNVTGTGMDPTYQKIKAEYYEPLSNNYVEGQKYVDFYRQKCDYLKKTLLYWKDNKETIIKTYNLGSSGGRVIKYLALVAHQRLGMDGSPQPK